ncbi:hypothetical protein WEI85_43490 [Actinomycetes bacterium KLBMP 9797]
MSPFTFAFSYDRRSRVAWLTLAGRLDTAGTQRLHDLVRTIVLALAPTDVLIDLRATTSHDPSGDSAIDALRWFPAALSAAGGNTDGRVCDIVLLFPPGTDRELDTWRRRVSIPPRPATAQPPRIGDPPRRAASRVA